LAIKHIALGIKLDGLARQSPLSVQHPACVFVHGLLLDEPVMIVRVVQPIPR